MFQLMTSMAPSAEESEEALVQVRVGRAGVVVESTAAPVTSGRSVDMSSDVDPDVAGGLLRVAMARYEAPLASAVSSALASACTASGNPACTGNGLPWTPASSGAGKATALPTG